MKKKAEVVIVVLGGGNPFDGSFPEHAKERVRVGITEYKKNPNSILLFSGNRCPAFDIPPPNTEAKMMRAFAILEGVSDSDMLVEQGSRHTIENALFTRLTLESHGLPKKLIVVTSDFHVPRVKLIFETLFGDMSVDLSFIAAKTTNLSVQNLDDKVKNEEKGLQRFTDFLQKMRDQKHSPKSLFEWKELIDTFY